MSKRVSFKEDVTISGNTSTTNNINTTNITNTTNNINSTNTTDNIDDDILKFLNINDDFIGSEECIFSHIL
jgi:hypothetical protein